MCNAAREVQGDSGGVPDAGILISGDAILKAFTSVLSGARYDTYLADFPHLEKHFERFRGQPTFRFTKLELTRLMNGLVPDGDPLLRELFEIDLLQPLRASVATARSFEVPRLYRIGLGLRITGRPWRMLSSRS